MTTGFSSSSLAIWNRHTLLPVDVFGLFVRPSSFEAYLTLQATKVLDWDWGQIAVTVKTTAIII